MVQMKEKTVLIRLSKRYEIQDKLNYKNFIFMVLDVK